MAALSAVERAAIGPVASPSDLIVRLPRPAHFRDFLDGATSTTAVEFFAGGIGVQTKDGVDQQQVTVSYVGGNPESLLQIPACTTT
jgi:hypothetical protein